MDIVQMYSWVIIVESQVWIPHCTLSFFRVCFFLENILSLKLILHRWQQSSGDPNCYHRFAGGCSNGFIFKLATRMIIFMISDLRLIVNVFKYYCIYVVEWAYRFLSLNPEIQSSSSWIYFRCNKWRLRSNRTMVKLIIACCGSALIWHAMRMVSLPTLRITKSI